MGRWWCRGIDSAGWCIKNMHSDMNDDTEKEHKEEQTNDNNNGYLKERKGSIIDHEPSLSPQKIF